MAPKWPLSHSYLDTFQHCPYQAYRRWEVPKNERVQKATNAIRIGDDVHSTIARYLRHGGTLPDDLSWMYELLDYMRVATKLYIEKKFALKDDLRTATDFFDSDCTYRGVLDAAAIFDSETNRSALLVDWKSGKVKEEPSQLEEQILGLLSLDPMITHISAAYVWLQEKRLGRECIYSSYGDTERKWYQDRLRDKIRQVDHARDANMWPKKQHFGCKWCPVKECEFNENVD